MDAPWYNDAAEALIKTVKRALTTAIGEQVLTYSELQTCVFEAAQLVNQRPIGIHPSHPNQGAYLSLNDSVFHIFIFSSSKHRWVEWWLRLRFVATCSN